jgi:hypothetical protein
MLRRLEPPMSNTVTREEFTALQVEGEKIVTRHILEQTRCNGDDLAALKTRMDRVERKLDQVDAKVEGLVKELPRIVGATMREVLSERDSRS